MYCASTCTLLQLIFSRSILLDEKMKLAFITQHALAMLRLTFLTYFMPSAVISLFIPIILAENVHPTALGYFTATYSAACLLASGALLSMMTKIYDLDFIILLFLVFQRFLTYSFGLFSPLVPPSLGGLLDLHSTPLWG